MVLQKIRKKGARWFFWRLINEFRNPSKAITKSLIDGALNFRRKLVTPFKADSSDDLLYSIIDLKIFPITFDITENLVDSEYEANKLGKKGFIIVFVPQGRQQSYGWDEYDSLFDSESKLWRFHNIVLPITLLAPSCKGIYILPRRSDVTTFIQNKDVHPNIYDEVNLRIAKTSDLYKKLDRPNLIKGLRASKQGLRYIEAWYKSNKIQSKVVSITIRQSLFDKARNSNLKEWKKFIKYLKDEGYFPVVIPDTDSAFKTENPFPESHLFMEGAWNMGLRMALYETSYVNFFSPNGPSRLAVWNPKCSYICMNSLPKDSIVTTEEYFKERDHKIGENYKFALPNQRFVFTPESFESIVQEFEKFVNENRNSK
jgi:hypothetical protein